MLLPAHYEPTFYCHRLEVRPEDQILGLEWPPAGELARLVVTRSRARSTRKYPSWKVGRMVQAESPGERNSYVLLDACPLVDSFREQPVIIRYVLDGESHYHVPDSLVETTDGRRELWEIKPRADAQDALVQARTRLMQARLPDHGFGYRLVLAEDVGSQPRLSLAQDLLRHGRRDVDGLLREQVRNLFKTVRHVKWQSTTNADLAPSWKRALCRLTLEGVLFCDSDARLTPETRFSWAGLSS